MDKVKKQGRTKGSKNAKDANKTDAKILKHLATTDLKLKDILQRTSSGYFAPNERGVSKFDIDFDALDDPRDRITTQIKIAEFHTAKPKSVDISMDATVRERTIEDDLRALSLSGD